MMFRGGGFCPFCGSGGGTAIGGLLMLLFGLLVVAGVVLLVVWAVREFSGHAERPQQPGTARYEPPGYGRSQAEQDAAVAIARERYARGEISREELDEILASLRRV